MEITKASALSGNINTREIDCTQEQMENFLNGTKVQDAFPHLSADDREFILSGITPEEWNEVFGEEE